MTVHDNVVFEANTAGDEGGAVSLPFHTVFLRCVGVLRRLLRGLVCFAEEVDPASSLVSSRLECHSHVCHSFINSTRITLFQRTHSRTSMYTGGVLKVLQRTHLWCLR